MHAEKLTIAIIIPVLNEAMSIHDFMDRLDQFHQKAGILFVDGGSTDDTVLLCRERGFEVIDAPMGRARQMNAGAAIIKADVYWFLHADCLPPQDALQAIEAAINSDYSWGRFDVCLTGKRCIYQWIAHMMNWRSCMTGVATGDQGVFIQSSLFERIGGYPDIPLMEDIAVSKRLRKHSRLACLHSLMKVSSRRWEKRGVYKTIISMWLLRLRYSLGESPKRLHQIYYGDDQ